MSEIDKLGDKIQYLERQIADKDADISFLDLEIEQLKARIAFMASNDYVHSLTSKILACAAIMENGVAVTAEFISDLRKAAE